VPRLQIAPAISVAAKVFDGAQAVRLMIPNYRATHLVGEILYISRASNCHYYNIDEPPFDISFESLKDRDHLSTIILNIFQPHEGSIVTEIHGETRRSMRVEGNRNEFVETFLHTQGKAILCRPPSEDIPAGKSCVQKGNNKKE
jgi:hypothetical protein